MKQFFSFSVLLLLLISCQAAQPTPEIVMMNGRFTPPNGKILFIVGQDVASINEYVAEVGPAPGGFTEYTSVENLEGITAVANYGSGPHHLNLLATTYENSTIALGLSVVDYLDNIASGRADENIDRLLDYLGEYGRPVYLRFGYEFDGSWNHYNPEEYVAAWIYFYQKVKNHNADNVAMVWQSASYCDGTFQGHPIDAWYPGDEYVDWVGLSFFIQTACNLEPLEAILAFAREHNKPVMIAESTPQQYDLQHLTFSKNGRTYEDRTADEIWQEWFTPYFDFIYDNADIIRAVAYINARWDDQAMWGPPYASGYWGDSRIEANDSIHQQWENELSKQIWLHSQDDLYNLLKES